MLKLINNALQIQLIEEAELLLCSHTKDWRYKCVFKCDLNKSSLCSMDWPQEFIFHKEGIEMENLVSFIFDAGTVSWSWLEVRSVHDGLYGCRLTAR